MAALQKNRGWFYWLLALIITLASAAYQRRTGPTYPLEGKAYFQGQEISYTLQRSHGGAGDQEVRLALPDTSIQAYLIYRRYPTNDEWTRVKMQRHGDDVVGYLPHQPPAGKIEYYIRLEKNGQAIHLPENRSAVTRFKGHVPAGVLVPHILFMFLAMFFSTRAGLAAAFEPHSARRYVWPTFVLITLGGMVLGPFVQKFAFGAYWTGIPFGWDLTDNKTLIAWILWLVALLRNTGPRHSRSWILAASVVMLLVFLIPHSVMGSELKYAETGMVPTTP